MCHGIEGHMKWSHVYCKQLIGGRRGEELRQLSAHCKTLPIHISYSVLIIILLDLHEDTKHSSIMQQVRVTCNFCHYFSIFERLISDNTWNGWSFVKILFLSCPGAIKRMQNAFSMHSKMLLSTLHYHFWYKNHHFRMHGSGLGFFNTIFKSHNFSSFKNPYNDLRRVCCSYATKFIIFYLTVIPARLMNLLRLRSGIHWSVE